MMSAPSLSPSGPCFCPSGVSLAGGRTKKRWHRRPIFLVARGVAISTGAKEFLENSRRGTLWGSHHNCSAIVGNRSVGSTTIWEIFNRHFRGVQPALMPPNRFREALALWERIGCCTRREEDLKRSAVGDRYASSRPYLRAWRKDQRPTRP